MPKMSADQPFAHLRRAEPAPRPLASRIAAAKAKAEAASAPRPKGFAKRVSAAVKKAAARD